MVLCSESISISKVYALLFFLSYSPILKLAYIIVSKKIELYANSGRYPSLKNLSRQNGL